MTWSGPGGQGDRQDGRLDGHLQVEPHLHGLPEQAQVAVLDVPAVLAEMDGDPVGAPQLGQHRRPDRVRLAPAPGLAQGGDMINIHAQS